MSELELVAGKQVERADFSSADNRSVRPPSLSEVGRSHRGNLRRLAFSGFHGLPPKISDGQGNPERQGQAAELAPCRSSPRGKTHPRPPSQTCGTSPMRIDQAVFRFWSERRQLPTGIRLDRAGVFPGLDVAGRSGRRARQPSRRRFLRAIGTARPQRVVPEVPWAAEAIV